MFLDHGATLSVSGSLDPTRAACQLKKKKKKNGKKERTKVYPKETEEHSLAKNKHKILKCGQKNSAWWTKGRKGKKGLSKGNGGFQKGGFRPYQPDKGAGKDKTQNKGKGKDQKGEGKEGAFHQPGLFSL